jgi:selenocysteine lyase/cysteine desulfurase
MPAGRRPCNAFFELTGWQGRPDPFAFDPFNLDFPASARRFETCTPAFAAIYAAIAGIRALLDLGLPRVVAHIAQLKHQAMEVFDDHELNPLYLAPP